MDRYGTFKVEDVDVMDQAGTAPITVFSGTNSGNNGANWTFNSGCSLNSIQFSSANSQLVKALIKLSLRLPELAIPQAPPRLI